MLDRSLCWVCCSHLCYVLLPNVDLSECIRTPEHPLFWPINMLWDVFDGWHYVQEAQLLLGDRATRKHAKDSWNGRGNDNLGWNDLHNVKRRTWDFRGSVEILRMGSSVNQLNFWRAIPPWPFIAHVSAKKLYKWHCLNKIPVNCHLWKMLLIWVL